MSLVGRHFRMFSSLLDELTRSQVIQDALLTPRIMGSVLVTATEKEQLEEFCAVSEMPELPVDELARLDDLYADNFGLGEKDPLKSSVA